MWVGGSARNIGHHHPARWTQNSQKDFSQQRQALCCWETKPEMKGAFALCPHGVRDPHDGRGVTVYM